MVQIQEQEEEDVDSQSQSQSQSKPQKKSSMEESSSSSPRNNNPPPSHSPDTSSSISSDHTFHGFSPRRDDPDHPSPLPSPPPPVQPIANLFVRDQPDTLTKTEPDAETGFAAGDQRGHRRRRREKQPPRREKMVKRLGLGLRLFELVVCLVSFSVMAADRNRGWALDSFDRYTEFRYSMSINVIGFAYSALQGVDLLCQLTREKDLNRSKLRYYIDFAMDQILAYLLLSSSSSAFTRVDDWISNWGQDKFPAMASASVGVSFIAFLAFALSSLISGYLLCTHSFT